MITGRGARIRRRLGRGALRLSLLILSALMAIPFLWMVVTSMRSEDDYRLAPGKVRIDWPDPAGRVTLERAYARDRDFVEVPLARFGEEGRASVAGAPSARTEKGLAIDLSRAAGEAVVRCAFDPPIRVQPLADVSVWAEGDGSGAELSFRLGGEKGSWATERPVPTLFRRRVRIDLSEVLLTPAGAARRAARMRPEGAAPAALDPGAIRLLEIRLRPVSSSRALLSRASENFGKAFDRMPFGRMYGNSLLVAAAVTLLQVFTSSLAAFAFARMRFFGRDVFFLGYLATLMVPYHVTMIPAYLMIARLHWFDTYWALVLPAAFSAYGTFMLRQFFLAIPKDLEDAARIDGCGAWGIYRHVVLPLSRPALATLAIFTFLSTWQAFLWPLIVTQKETMLTLPVGLRKFDDVYGGPNAPLTMAAALVVMVPALVVFAANQRFYTKGIAAGGIKE